MRKIKKVPVILQMEAVECGAASLTMILAYYKKYIPLEKMRIECNVTRDGSSAKYIVKAAMHNGLEAKAYKMDPEQIRQREDFPMIIHWNFNHFVVLCGFDGEEAVINDPASGRIKVAADVFDRSFTGIAMCFRPGEKFQPQGSPKTTKSFLGRELARMKPALFFVTILGIIYSLIQILSPVFYKIFTDRILLGGAPEWMEPLMLIMLAAAAALLVSGCLKNLFLQKMMAKFRICNTSRFFWKLLRLPMSFFDQRFSGDIVSRERNNEEIAAILFQRIVPSIMDLVLVCCLMFLMFLLDPRMAGVVLAAGVMQLLCILALTENYGNLSRGLGRDGGKLSGIKLSGISMIETVKASGAERGIVEKILGYQAKYDNAALKMASSRIYLETLPGLLEGICNGLILILGIQAVFQGKQTIGTLVAFQAFLQLCFAPMASLAGCIQALQEMKGSIERVQDVLEYEEEIDETKIFCAAQEGKERLEGRIDMKNITFGYSPAAPPLIRDFDMHAEPGQVIALVGGSGSGKSTLAKLLCGLYPCNSGEIRYDDIPIGELDHYLFHSSVAVVDQNISLFGGTIWDNITMWNEEISQEKVVEACKDACIHQDILMRKNGYQYEISEGGSDFSGGQRQRLEIARAFVMEPGVMILDEATSALDVMTEQKIMGAVRKRGLTCIIIAHRLSTIRDADEIIMLEQGVVKERGTHEELMEQEGAYAALLHSD